MKKFLSVFSFVSLILTGCSSGKRTSETISSRDKDAERPVSTNFSEPSTWLLGYLSYMQFLKAPHSEWFLKGFETYQPADEVVGKLFEVNKENIAIKIVLGTWCPDSRREVPRFMKIIDRWQFPLDKVVYIGVDNSKIAPVGGYDTLGIERVPTFIILRNKIEAGRIIENPVTSLEQDMLDFLTRNED